MENLADQMKNHQAIAASKIYTLFSLSIVIFLFCFRSYGSFAFTFFEKNDRHYIFLLCQGILVFLIINSGSIRTSQTQSKHSQPETTSYIHHLPEPVAVQEAPEAKPIECPETEQDVVNVHDEHEIAATVEEEEEEDNDHNAHSTTQDQTECPETEQAVNVGKEHETMPTVEEEDDEEEDQNARSTTQDQIQGPETEKFANVHEEYESMATIEEDDKEEAEELKLKCEEFIKKMRERIQHEANLFG